MAEYHVTWTIDLDTDSAREAALLALAIQRDPQSTAVVFDVAAEGKPSVAIDLLEDPAA